MTLGANAATPATGRQCLKTHKISRWPSAPLVPLPTSPAGAIPAMKWLMVKLATAAYVISDMIMTIGINSGWNKDLISALSIATTFWLTGGMGPESLTTTHIVTVSIMGGITSVLQGGKFGHGFVAAGLSAIGGQAIKGAEGLKGTGQQFLAKITLGGTISKMTGGKFANGAQGAAFAMVVQHIGTGLNNSQSSISAPTPDIDTTMTSSMPEGGAMVYESGGGNYSKSAQQAPSDAVMPRIVNEVVVIGQRPSTARNGYYHVPRCDTCIRPTYPTPVAPAFSIGRVNNLTADIVKATGQFMLNSAAGASGVGVARVGLVYFAKHPAKLAGAIRAGANTLDEAGLVDGSIGVTSSGRPPIEYQHIVRDTTTHMRK